MIRKPKKEVLTLEIRFSFNLSIPGRPLQTRYFAAYTVEKEASGLNYIILHLIGANKSNFIILIY